MQPHHTGRLPLADHEVRQVEEEYALPFTIIPTGDFIRHDPALTLGKDILSTSLDGRVSPLFTTQDALLRVYNSNTSLIGTLASRLGQVVFRDIVVNATPGGYHVFPGEETEITQRKQRAELLHTPRGSVMVDKQGKTLFVDEGETHHSHLSDGLMIREYEGDSYVVCLETRSVLRKRESDEAFVEREVALFRALRQYFPDSRLVRGYFLNDKLAPFGKYVLRQDLCKAISSLRNEGVSVIASTFNLEQIDQTGVISHLQNAFEAFRSKYVSLGVEPPIMHAAGAYIRRLGPRPLPTPE